MSAERHPVWLVAGDRSGELETNVRFDGKTVMVTGGASGIGRASCMKFAGLGAGIVAADRDADGLAETAELIRSTGGTVDTVVGDMTDSSTVEALMVHAVERYGRIDAFHCNAGIQGKLGPIYNYAEAEFDRVIAINTKGVFLGLRHVLPVMMKQRAGAVVITCSVASLGGMANLPAYVASKHAALGLVRAAAMDVAEHGVRVNGVCPGAVDTPMLTEVVTTIAPNAQAAAMARFAAGSPIGRLITADEIADAVVYLCSDSARSTTGSYMVVDGGLSTRIGGATRSA